MLASPGETDNPSSPFTAQLEEAAAGDFDETLDLLAIDLALTAAALS
jgi:hypothetical protein